jgi:hypothetical protein
MLCNIEYDYLSAGTLVLECLHCSPYSRWLRECTTYVT